MTPRVHARVVIVALLATILLAGERASAAEVCYQLPFSNPNLADGWGSLCCGRTTPHRGVDFAQPMGTKVPSVADGEVVRVTSTGCLGKVVVVKHPDGVYSGYAHLNSALVGVGQKVSKGDHIATTGNSGTCTTGPHLHLTLSPEETGYMYGTTVDPYAYIKAHEKCDCDRAVDTSSVGSFTFSCDGANANQHCVNVNEPGDPTSWGDNNVCTSWDHGLIWSHDGPIAGMDCTAVGESASPYASAWADNHLCAPPQAFVELAWSSAGPISGQPCFNWNEPSALSGSWADNYLCIQPRSDYSAAGVTFSSDGPNEGKSCVSLNEPADPDSWQDNHLCTDADEGFAWSHAGPIDAMRCTQIVEAAGNDGEGWDDNYLCVPESSTRELVWSSAGATPGMECLRFAELADPDGSWRDNWLCIGVRSDPAADASTGHQPGAWPPQGSPGDGGVAGGSAEPGEGSTDAGGCSVGVSQRGGHWLSLAALAFLLARRRRG